MKNIRFIALVSCLLSLFFISCVAPASAKNSARIAGVSVSEGNGGLEVSFRIEDCFTPKMEEAIKAGVLTTFRFRTVIEKPGISPLGGRILDDSFERAIKYDLLKNEYQVRVPDLPDKILRTRDFEEAKRWVSGVRGHRLISLKRLDRGETYQLRLKAELSKIDLPFYFRYILFFDTLWDFETDWHSMSFTPTGIAQ